MSCIGCGINNLSKKKKIILLSVISAMAVILYYSYTINSAITLTVLPFVLPFLGCIVMCGVMVGAMFLAGRFSKKSDISHSCSTNELKMTEPMTKPEIDTNAKKDHL